LVSHNKAPVVVVNNTKIKFSSVSVAHKYSENYNSTCQWTNIESGTTTNPQPVDYNTGTFTTGRSWWYIVMVTDGGEIYHTDPSNGRAFLDKTEKVVLDVGTGVISASSAVAGAFTVLRALMHGGYGVPNAPGQGGPGALAPNTNTLTMHQAVGGLIGIAIYTFTQLVANSASTAGFKMFDLTSEDASAFSSSSAPAGNAVKININISDGGNGFEVVFTAPSGTASTPLYLQYRASSPPYSISSEGKITGGV